MKTLVVVAGATAIGKTDLCVKLAYRFKTEVISADSRQFYKEMSIGTAKPTSEEMTYQGAQQQQIIPHHFIDSHSIHRPISAGEYEKEALPIIQKLFKNKDILILTGGSGLFIQAICEGFDAIPSIPKHFRAELNQELNEFGLEKLVSELKRKDPQYASEADLNNPQRVTRALEIIRSSNKKYSEYRRKNQTQKEERMKSRLAQLGFSTLKIMLNCPREELYERINQRVLNMVELGLIEEVRNLRKYASLSPLKTVGYQELFEYLDEKVDLETAIATIQQNTRRFAKRQLTWFRKDSDYHWFDISEEKTEQRIIELIQSSSSNSIKNTS